MDEQQNRLRVNWLDTEKLAFILDHPISGPVPVE